MKKKSSPKKKAANQPHRAATLGSGAASRTVAADKTRSAPRTPSTFRRGRGPTADTKRHQEQQRAAAQTDAIRRARFLIEELEQIRLDSEKLSKAIQAGDSNALLLLFAKVTHSLSAIFSVNSIRPDLVSAAMAQFDLRTFESIGVLYQEFVAQLKSSQLDSHQAEGVVALNISRSLTHPSSLATFICGFLEACWMLARRRGQIRSIPAKGGKAKTRGTAVAPCEQIDAELFKQLLFSWRRGFSLFGSTLSDAQAEEFIEKCAKLPPLSQEEWKKWFAIGREVLMHLTNGRPEEVPELRSIAGLRVDPITRKTIFDGQAYDPKKQRGLVRDRIVSSVRYAFQSKLTRGL